MLASPGKLITEPGERRWGCGIAPVSRQISGLNSFAGHVLRDVGDCQDKIRRGIVLIEMYEILQHRQGLMFGDVTKASSGA